MGLWNWFSAVRCFCSPVSSSTISHSILALDQSSTFCWGRKPKNKKFALVKCFQWNVLTWGTENSGRTLPHLVLDLIICHWQSVPLPCGNIWSDQHLHLNISDTGSQHGVYSLCCTRNKKEERRPCLNKALTFHSYKPKSCFIEFLFELISYTSCNWNCKVMNERVYCSISVDFMF